MSEQACKTPLVDLLRGIPKDFHGKWKSQWTEDGRAIGYTMSPVGLLAHEAADTVDALRAEVERLKNDRKMFEDICEAHALSAIHDCEQAEAENARLRDALRIIASLPESRDDEACNIAEQALKGE